MIKKYLEHKKKWNKFDRFFFKFNRESFLLFFSINIKSFDFFQFDYIYDFVYFK